jgi:hypothetical protein
MNLLPNGEQILHGAETLVSLPIMAALLLGSLPLWLPLLAMHKWSRRVALSEASGKR